MFLKTEVFSVSLSNTSKELVLVQSNKKHSTMYRKHCRIKFSCHTEWGVSGTSAQVAHWTNAEAKPINNDKDVILAYEFSVEIPPHIFFYYNFLTEIQSARILSTWVFSCNMWRMVSVFVCLCGYQRRGGREGERERRKWIKIHVKEKEIKLHIILWNQYGMHRTRWTEKLQRIKSRQKMCSLKCANINISNSGRP